MKINQFIRIGEKEYRVRSVPMIHLTPPKSILEIDTFAIDYTEDDLMDKEAVFTHREVSKYLKMIKISISLLLDAIEDNINDGENGEFLVKEEAFETLPLDRGKKDKIIEQIKQNSQNVFKDDFDTLLQLYY